MAENVVRGWGRIGKSGQQSTVGAEQVRRPGVGCTGVVLIGADYYPTLSHGRDRPTEKVTGLWGRIGERGQQRAIGAE